MQVEFKLRFSISASVDNARNTASNVSCPAIWQIGRTMFIFRTGPMHCREAHRRGVKNRKVMGIAGPWSHSHRLLHKGKEIKYTFPQFMNMRQGQKFQTGKLCLKFDVKIVCSVFCGFCSFAAKMQTLLRTGIHTFPASDTLCRM